MADDHGDEVLITLGNLTIVALFVVALRAVRGIKERLKYTDDILMIASAVRTKCLSHSVRYYDYV